MSYDERLQQPKSLSISNVNHREFIYKNIFKINMQGTDHYCEYFNKDNSENLGKLQQQKSCRICGNNLNNYPRRITESPIFKVFTFPNQPLICHYCVEQYLITVFSVEEIYKTQRQEAARQEEEEETRREIWLT